MHVLHLLRLARFKVMRCMHEREGDVVVKLFIHRRLRLAAACRGAKTFALPRQSHGPWPSAREGQPDLKELQRRIHQAARHSRQALATDLWIHDYRKKTPSGERTSSTACCLQAVLYEHGRFGASSKRL